MRRLAIGMLTLVAGLTLIGPSVDAQGDSNTDSNTGTATGTGTGTATGTPAPGPAWSKPSTGRSIERSATARRPSFCR